MDNKNDKIKAIATTLGVHALLAILLAFLTLSAAKPEHKDEDGVPVMLEQEEVEVPQSMAADEGGTDQAAEEDDAGDGGSEASVEDLAPKVGNQSPQQKPVQPTPAAALKQAPVEKEAARPDAKPAKPLVTQDTERSIAAEKAAKKKAEEEAAAKKKAAEEAAARKAAEAAAAKKRAEEAAAKKAAEEAAAAAAASKVAGAFGKTSGSGTGSKSGSGSSGGAGTGGSGTGSGAGGVGGTASVGSRTVKYLATPSYSDATNEGTIVVAITVSPAGSVTSATIKSSTTTSSPLRNSAIAAAKQSKFSEGANTENGTITYRFKLR